MKTVLFVTSQKIL